MLLPQFARRLTATLLTLQLVGYSTLAVSQTPPHPTQIAQYASLHSAAHHGNIQEVKALIAQGVDLEARDDMGRTALHVAAFAAHGKVIEALAEAGANMNALENDAYDIVTIAAVANDIETLDVAIKNGTSAANTTSRYDGTALIAAAHLGHKHVVERLIAAGAPLDHINNLGWTALIESVVLGDGGPDHVAAAHALVVAGADKSIPDRNGVTALEHAQRNGFSAMVDVLK